MQTSLSINTLLSKETPRIGSVFLVDSRLKGVLPKSQKIKYQKPKNIIPNNKISKVSRLKRPDMTNGFLHKQEYPI